MHLCVKTVYFQRYSSLFWTTVPHGGTSTAANEAEHNS